MNLSEMRTRARLYLDDENAGQFTNGEVTNLLNAAQQHVAQVIEEKDPYRFTDIETYSILADPDAYEVQFPADFKKVLLVERSDGRDIPIVCSYVDFRRRHEGMSATEMDPAFLGHPKFYLRGKWLGIVRPSTNMTIKVWYSRRLPDLVNDGDTSDVPSEHHDLICLDAAKRGFGATGVAMPQELRELYDRQVSELQFSVSTRQSQDATQVRWVPEY